MKLQLDTFLSLAMLGALVFLLGSIFL